VRFDLLQAISLAGDAATPNDDRCGTRDALAWVIDGATDLGEPGLVGTRGGAAWIAQEADAAFRSASDAPLQAICRDVADHIAGRFQAERRRAPHGAWELPSASFLAARAAPDTLDLAWSGDCTALIKRGAAVTRLGPRADQRDEEAAHAASLADHGLARKQRPAPILASLREQRGRAGRAVLSADPSLVTPPVTATVAAEAGDELLLMSDGFAALIDQYAAFDVAGLFATLTDEGLAGLAVRLRAIEREDSDCRRYPRFKVSDDATALWMRCAT